MDTEIKTVRKLSIFHPVLDPMRIKLRKVRNGSLIRIYSLAFKVRKTKKGHTSIPKTSTTDIFVDRITGINHRLRRFAFCV